MQSVSALFDFNILKNRYHLIKVIVIFLYLIKLDKLHEQSNIILLVLEIEALSSRHAIKGSRECWPTPSTGHCQY